MLIRNINELHLPIIQIDPRFRILDINQISTENIKPISIEIIEINQGMQSSDQYKAIYLQISGKATFTFQIFNIDQRPSSGKHDN